MLVWGLASAIAAAAAFLASGYILGVKRGQDARDALRKELESISHRNDAGDIAWDKLRHELAAIQNPIEKNHSLLTTIRARMATGNNGSLARDTGLSASDVTAAIRPLLANLPGSVADKIAASANKRKGDGSSDREDVAAKIKPLFDELRKDIHSSTATTVDSTDVAARVIDALRPLLESSTKKPGLESSTKKPNLSSLSSSRRTRDDHPTAPSKDHTQLIKTFSGLTVEGGVGHGLEQLLEAMVKHSSGLVRCAVISDDAGLPLAGTSSCDNIDALAGISSLLLFVTKRIPRHGGVAPESILMLAAEKESVLYRVFKAGERIYTLSIVTDDAHLKPEIFEPIVAKLQKLLPGRQGGAKIITDQSQRRTVSGK